VKAFLFIGSAACAALLVACASNSPGSAVPSSAQVASPTFGQRQQSKAPQGSPTLYVLQGPSLSDFQVAVYGDAGAKYKRTIDIGDPPRQLVAFGVDLHGLLYATAAQNGRPATLNVYTNDGSKVLRKIHQRGPFLGAMFDPANNLYSLCGTHFFCERANGKSKITRKFKGTGSIFASDSNGDVALGEDGSISVFAPGSTTPYWTITNGITEERLDWLTFDSNENLYASLAGAQDKDASILVFPPNATTASITITDGILRPNELAIDAADNLYVMNEKNITVYSPGSTSPSWTISDGVSGGGLPYYGYGTQMAFDKSGNLYVANFAEGVSVYAPGGTTPIRTITQGITNAYSVSLSP
jgi:hypothetical protein